jgi:hypothetical protein
VAAYGLACGSSACGWSACGFSVGVCPAASGAAGGRLATDWPVRGHRAGYRLAGGGYYVGGHRGGRGFAHGRRAAYGSDAYRPAVKPADGGRLAVRIILRQGHRVHRAHGDLRIKPSFELCCVRSHLRSIVFLFEQKSYYIVVSRGSDIFRRHVEQMFGVWREER